MSEEETDPVTSRIAAMQLLFADVSDEDAYRIIKASCQGRLIILDNKSMSDLNGDARLLYEISHAITMDFDGSSPMGRIAQERLSKEVSRVKTLASSISIRLTGAHQNYKR